MAGEREVMVPRHSRAGHPDNTRFRSCGDELEGGAGASVFGGKRLTSGTATLTFERIGGS